MTTDGGAILYKVLAQDACRGEILEIVIFDSLRTIL